MSAAAVPAMNSYPWYPEVRRALAVALGDRAGGGLPTLIREVVDRLYRETVPAADRVQVGITGYGYGAQSTVPVVLVRSSLHTIKWAGCGTWPGLLGADPNAAIADDILRSVWEAYNSLSVRTTRVKSGGVYAALPRVRMAFPVATVEVSGAADAGGNRLSFSLCAFLVRDADPRPPSATAAAVRVDDTRPGQRLPLDSEGAVGRLPHEPVKLAEGAATDFYRLSNSAGQVLAGLTVDGRPYYSRGVTDVLAAIDALLDLPPEALFSGTTEAREVIDRLRAARAAVGLVGPNDGGRP